MKKFFGSIALAAITAVLTPPALKAQGAPLCGMGNAVMNGAYVTSGTGTIVGVGPITTVGLVVYKGDGTGVSVFSTVNVNGATLTSSNAPATFTVNPDCTGSKTIGASHFNFVVSPDGSTINWIVTDSGVSMSGTAIRLKR